MDKNRQMIREGEMITSKLADILIDWYDNKYR